MKIYELKNRNGVEVRVTDFGGIVMSIKTPDRHGDFADIVLGFDTPEEYPAGPPFFGAIIGRYGNRIAGGRFMLDGEEYRLPLNNGPNQLHGGDEGFHTRMWRIEPYEDAGGQGLKLFHVSPDGHMGFPGELSVEADYKLTHENALEISFEAATTKPTHVNLTHHSYFNLSGDLTAPITGHALQLNASRYTPVDDTLIPTGELRPVEGTAFDLRSGPRIGDMIDADDEQLALCGGYDHNFVLDNQSGAFETAAALSDPVSGRIVELKTTEPGLQFYSGNALDGSLHGKGAPIGQRTGLCLEPQHYPDSPNKPAFPSTVLRPGEIYRSRMALIFSVLP